jgi:hypothetical protein
MELARNRIQLQLFGIALLDFRVPLQRVCNMFDAVTSLDSSVDTSLETY